MLRCQLSGGEGMEGSLKAPKVRRHRDAVSAGVLTCRREAAEQKGFSDIHVKENYSKVRSFTHNFPPKRPLPVTENEAERKINQKVDNDWFLPVVTQGTYKVNKKV